MTFPETTLRLALLGLASLFLAACPVDEGKDDTEDEDPCEGAAALDANCDGLVSCDEDPSGSDCTETGIYQQYWYVKAATDDLTTLSDGGFGMSFVGLTNDAGTLCTAYAEWTDGGAGPDGCPSCVWAFTPAGTGAGPSSGDYCEDLGYSNDALGAYADAGYFVYPIGFAEEYYWEAYQVTVTEAMFLYIDEWFIFGYNYGSYYSVYGDKYAVELYRAAGDGYGGGVYDYYYPH